MSGLQLNMVDEANTSLHDRLILAALDSLEHGEEVGLRAVARRIGVSAMAPYRHFQDKAALLAAVVACGFDDLRTALRAADKSPDPAEALVAQGEAYLAFARSRPALFRLMFADRGAQRPPVDGTAYGVMVARVRQLAPRDADAAILACWGVVHGLAMLALDGRWPSGETGLERAALRLAISGLRT